MTPGLVVKLRPTTPWRPGSDSGARDQVETLYHSDSLYSAVSAAMARLGMLEEWLDATARAPGGAEVCLSSCFPFQNNLMMVVPPRNFWPPAPSPRVRWNSARFIPLSLLALLLRGRAPDEERWMVDGASGCLVASGTAGPFRVARRSQAAVDRVNGAQAAQSWACLEFTPGAGLWTTAVFAGEEAGKRWMEPVRAAFRLLADTGFGGRRSIGWGRCAAPEFLEGAFPEVVLPAEWPAPAPPPGNQEEPAAGPEAVAWLWSLFVPAALDAIDWRRGFYSLASRTGRIESPAAAGGLKQSVNMVEEGSVLFAGGAIRGSAVDVAPDGFAHPVYRAGFAVAVSVPWIPGYPGAVLPPDGEHKPVGRPKEAGEQGERSLALILPLAGEKEETPAVEEPSTVSTQPSAEPEAAVEAAPAITGPEEPGEAEAGAQEQVTVRIEEAEEPPAVEEPSAVSTQLSAEPEAAAVPEEPGLAEAGAQEQVTVRIEEAE
ncbi:MAG: hypothetical protein IT158_26920, partial [Bryobacterales bacterium]|nr:hypothetical protein [Bryobacterales bacterium]